MYSAANGYLGSLLTSEAVQHQRNLGRPNVAKTAQTCRSVPGRSLRCSFTRPAIRPSRGIFEGRRSTVRTFWTLDFQPSLMQLPFAGAAGWILQCVAVPVCSHSSGIFTAWTSAPLGPAGNPLALSGAASSRVSCREGAQHAFGAFRSWAPPKKSSTGRVSARSQNTLAVALLRWLVSLNLRPPYTERLHRKAH